MTKEGISTRKVIGSVDTSEFAVAVSASIGFFISLGWEKVAWQWVGALMLGGIIAAPIAAWLVKIIPSYILGVFVGGFIILTNLKVLLMTFTISGGISYFLYSVLTILWIAAIVFSYKNGKKESASSRKKTNFFKNSVDY
jgi:hypothetical protein